MDHIQSFRFAKLMGADGCISKDKSLVLAVANIDFFVSTCVKTYVSECQRISSDIVS